MLSKSYGSNWRCTCIQTLILFSTSNQKMLNFLTHSCSRSYGNLVTLKYEISKDTRYKQIRMSIKLQCRTLLCIDPKLDPNFSRLQCSLVVLYELVRFYNVLENIIERITQNIRMTNCKTYSSNWGKFR